MYQKLSVRAALSALALLALASATFAAPTIQATPDVSAMLTMDEGESNETAESLIGTGGLTGGGADMFESMRYVSQHYYDYYFTTAFARNRATFTTAGYRSRITGRYMDQAYYSMRNLVYLSSIYQNAYANVPGFAQLFDTPSIAGFTASVSWGEDDRWGGALRYSQDWNGLAVEAGIGYDNNTDERCAGGVVPGDANGDGTVGPTEVVPAGVGCDFQAGPGGEIETFLASASFYHASSGLFGVVSYGQQDRNIAGIDDATNWYGKLGIRRNFFGYGETALYGEYTHSEDVTPGTEGDQWGLGVGQDIDAVGGTMYLGYRHSEADVPGLDLEDHDQILTGMVLPF